jgi:hypothetical protein
MKKANSFFVFSIRASEPRLAKLVLESRVFIENSLSDKPCGRGYVIWTGSEEQRVGKLRVVGHVLKSEVFNQQVWVDTSKLAQYVEDALRSERVPYGMAEARASETTFRRRKKLIPYSGYAEIVKYDPRKKTLLSLRG